jgi:hypothetical protein
MELFPAANDDQWTLIKKVINECDYYLVIIAGRYGSIGPDGLSYTEMEYRYALDQKKPIISFIRDNPQGLPPNMTESTRSGQRKLAAFRALAKKKNCCFWDSPSELGRQVSWSLGKLIKSDPRVGWIRADEIPPPSRTGSPEELFAQSLIEFARSLASLQRDQTLLELRSWSSRLLHLIGALSERQELGQLAFAAAAVAQDRVAQASILIDDLGWSVHEFGDTPTGLQNVLEGLSLLDREIATRPSLDRAEVIALKVKALRHVANMRSLGAENLAESRHAFQEPRELAAELEPVSRALNVAQLAHSEALVIFSWVTAAMSGKRKLDPASLPALLDEAIGLAEDAERSFRSLGDVEREAKALKLKVDMLALVPQKELHREAAARLHRLELQIARHLR